MCCLGRLCPGPRAPARTPEADFRASSSCPHVAPPPAEKPNWASAHIHNHFLSRESPAENWRRAAARWMAGVIAFRGLTGSSARPAPGDSARRLSRRFLPRKEPAAQAGLAPPAQPLLPAFASGLSGLEGGGLHSHSFQQEELWCQEGRALQRLSLAAQDFSARTDGLSSHGPAGLQPALGAPAAVPHGPSSLSPSRDAELVGAALPASPGSG